MTVRRILVTSNLVYNESHQLTWCVSLHRARNGVSDVGSSHATQGHLHHHYPAAEYTFCICLFESRLVMVVVCSFPPISQFEDSYQFSKCRSIGGCQKAFGRRCVETYVVPRIVSVKIQDQTLLFPSVECELTIKAGSVRAAHCTQRCWS